MNYKNKKCKISELRYIWKTVFHDSDRVLDSFFENVFPNADCFYLQKDGIAVSAVYLIPVVCSGLIGRYCYAAATLPSYRSHNYMKQLLREAITDCKKNGIDFLYVCPAEETLYPYYERLKFTKKLYAQCIPRRGSVQKPDAGSLQRSSQSGFCTPVFDEAVYSYAVEIETETVNGGIVYDQKEYYPVSGRENGRTVPFGLLLPLTASVLFDHFFMFLTLN